ncbi:MAG: hypothetical protein PHR06_15770 [Candidatus Cloacimonetes bacterium]|nr:hypothetical protein [Candidatus Cloacimonadota bacterium]
MPNPENNPCNAAATPNNTPIAATSAQPIIVQEKTSVVKVLGYITAGVAVIGLVTWAGFKLFGPKE